MVNMTRKWLAWLLTLPLMSHANTSFTATVTAKPLTEKITAVTSCDLQCIRSLHFPVQTIETNWFTYTNAYVFCLDTVTRLNCDHDQDKSASIYAKNLLLRLSVCFDDVLFLFGFKQLKNYSEIHSINSNLIWLCLNRSLAPGWIVR